MALTSGRFELGPRIGRGSSGDVHSAIDSATGAVVAVKLVDLEEAEDEVEDIQREISYLAQCNSEFVTKYLGSWLCEGRCWISEALDPQPATRNPQPATRNPQSGARNPQPAKP